jgi:hypothetical protein
MGISSTSWSSFKARRAIPKRSAASRWARIHPARSGITFTQGLAPEAWAADWRLGNEAEPVWTAYTRRREEMKLAPVEEISMEALTKMASYIFQNYAKKPGFTGLTTEQVIDVVDSAGMLQLEAMGKDENADEDEDEEDKAEETDAP